MKTPAFSIIVPCYNQSQYLSEALESVLAQKLQDWECIIINDGSTDETEVVAKSWLDRDRRFRYFKTVNSGLAAARNYGIEKACGQYILPLDSDDKIQSDYLKEAMEAFCKEPDLKVVYCKQEYFGKKSNHILPAYNYKDLLVQNMLFCSVVMKRDDLIEVGGYDVNMKYGFEDWELFINLLDENAKVYQIDKVLFFYRLKESSMLISLRDSPERQKFLFNYMATKHHAIYTKYFGSIIENLQLIRELKAQNKMLRSSVFNRILYAGKNLLTKLK